MEEKDAFSQVWGSFSFRSIKETDYPLVLDHFHTSFYKDEPAQIINGMNKDRESDMDQRIVQFMKQGKSFMAIDKGTGEIAGVTIIAHYSKDEDKDKVPEISNPRSPLTNKIRSFFIQLDSEFDLFKEYGITQYADIYILSVSPQFRRQGLGGHMGEMGVAILRDLYKYPLIKISATSPHTRNIVNKLGGFKQVWTKHYSEAKDKDGRFLWPNADQSQFVTIHVLDCRKS